MTTQQSSKIGTYRAVKAEILRRIRNRDWGPGDLLPPEVELAEDFGCARATVNRAMRELTDEGVLHRRRRAGTRVSAEPVRRARLDIALTRSEIEATGKTYGYKLLERKEENAPAWLCKSLDIASGTPIIHVSALHFAGNKPWQHELRWINLNVAPEAANETFTKTGPNEWLVSAVPFSDAAVEFSAAIANSDTAHQLKLDKGAPVFVAERTTWLHSTPITHARLSYPPDYRMRTTL